MEYIETDSTNIKKVGYDEGNSILEIWFHSGGKYWYFEFDKRHWENLVYSIEQGASVGKSFHHTIKSKFPYLNITHFGQDVEFDAILIQNRDKMGTEREYLKFSLLCEKHGWDFSDAWDKALGRTEWFDLQPQEYRNTVLGTVGDLCVEEEENRVN